MDQPAGRREFLRSLTIAGAATLPLPASPCAPASTAPPPPHAHASGAPATGSGVDALLFLTEPEWRFVEAAVDCLIPADELGPGAREAGVARYIDRQLASSWGVHARHYRQGPWPAGTPQQGYQSPLAPQDVYRIGIAQTGRHCLDQQGRHFDALATAERNAILTQLQHGAVPFTSLAPTVFFELLLANTREGFFADPMYGGNADKAGWRLIGYPGVAAAYGERLTDRNVPYRVEPVSIADVRQGLVAVDDHGHPRHSPLRPRPRRLTP